MTDPVVGVDEAGKGPVLGPMVAAAVRALPSVLPDGVDDSKRLTADRRERLAAALRSHPAVNVATATISVERIDAPETGMNELTLGAQIGAAEAVANAGDNLVADAADVDAGRFAGRLGVALDGVSVTAEHGADKTHPVVGAASVVAKVERDRRVAAIDEAYGPSVGSGYPSDPTTRDFLRTYVDEHGDLPPCARASWQTCADVLEAAAQSRLGEF